MESRQQHLTFNTNLVVISIVATLIGLFDAALVYIFRLGLETYSLPMIWMVVFLIFVCFSPFAFSNKFNKSPWQSTAIMAASILSIFPAAFLGRAVLVFYAGSAVLGLYRALKIILCISLIQWFVITLIASLLSVYLFFVVNQLGNTMFLTPERVDVGIEHRDVYLRLAFARIYEFHQALSTGLDGLKPIFYHWGFATFSGSFAMASDLSVIAYYAFLGSIVIAPLLMHAMVICSSAFITQVPSGPIAIFVISFFVLALLPFISWNFLGLQPGYLLALVLSLLAMPAVVSLAQNEQTNTPVIRLIYLFGIGGTVWLFHPTAGLVVAVTIWWALARGEVLSPMSMLGLSAVGIIAVIFAFQNFNVAFEFNLISFSRLKNEYKTFMLAGLIVPLAALWGGFSDRTNEYRILHVELIIIILAASFGPPLLFDFTAGSSQVYFFNVATCLVLPLLISSQIGANEKLCISEICPSPVSKVTFIFAFFLLLASFHPKQLFNNLVVRFDDLVKEVDGRDAQFLPMAKQAFTSERRIFPQRFVEKMNQMRGQQFITKVRAEYNRIGKQPLAVFVPPSNTDFWSVLHECKYQSFFIPATTGMPMMFGLPPEGCDIKKGMDAGYGLYGKAVRSSVISDQKICTRAIASGISHILILQDIKKTRSLACDTKKTQEIK